MKRIIGIVIFFSFVMIIGCAPIIIPDYLPNKEAKLVGFKPGSEPEGFNSIKWETKLSTLEGVKHCRTDVSCGGIEFYLKEGDAYKLGNGKALPVQYGFWRGKFYVGMVTTKNLSDWNALKESVFNKFGEGTKPFINKDEYLWVGENAIMALQYNEILKIGTFYIRSDSMAKQMENYHAEIKN